jgi:hypothetical protein
MRPVETSLRTSEPLAEVLPRLASSPEPFVPVVDEIGVLRGLLRPERVLALARVGLRPEVVERPPEVRVMRRAG